MGTQVWCRRLTIKLLGDRGNYLMLYLDWILMRPWQWHGTVYRKTRLPRTCERFQNITNLLYQEWRFTGCQNQNTLFVVLLKYKLYIFKLKWKHGFVLHSSVPMIRLIRTIYLIMWYVSKKIIEQIISSTSITPVLLFVMKWIKIFLNCFFATEKQVSTTYKTQTALHY